MTNVSDGPKPDNSRLPLERGGKAERFTRAVRLVTSPPLSRSEQQADELWGLCLANMSPRKADREGAVQP